MASVTSPLRIAAVGALVAGLCVAGGAFGAHALRSMVAPERLATFETAMRYGLVHGVALVALGALALAHLPLAPLARRVALLWGAGVALFTGSLVLLVLLDVRALGIVTPFGGVALIGGWLWLALGLLRHNANGA